MRELECKRTNNRTFFVVNKLLNLNYPFFIGVDICNVQLITNPKKCYANGLILFTILALVLLYDTLKLCQRTKLQQNCVTRFKCMMIHIMFTDWNHKSLCGN